MTARLEIFRHPLLPILWLRGTISVDHILASVLGTYIPKINEITRDADYSGGGKCTPYRRQDATSRHVADLFSPASFGSLVSLLHVGRVREALAKAVQTGQCTAKLVTCWRQPIVPVALVHLPELVLVQVMSF